MDKHQLAALLNGREYRKEITREEEKAANESGLVIVFGASDDLMEFRGAISDEVGCYDGGTASLNQEGLCKKKNRTAKIKALWCPMGNDGNIYASWAYQTKIPHAPFDIMEDGELYCRGIVFHVGDLTA